MPLFSVLFIPLYGFSSPIGLMMSSIVRGTFKQSIRSEITLPHLSSHSFLICILNGLYEIGVSSQDFIYVVYMDT